MSCLGLVLVVSLGLVLVVSLLLMEKNAEPKIQSNKTLTPKVRRAFTLTGDDQTRDAIFALLLCRQISLASFPFTSICQALPAIPSNLSFDHAPKM